MDRDIVELSNLSRSVLYRTEDAGQSKAEVAARQIRELNPDVRTAVFAGDLLELGTGAFRQVDIVLGCLDNRATRLAVSRACWRVGVPWIDGALDVLMGSVRVYRPPDGACYECTMTEEDFAQLEFSQPCIPGPAMQEAGHVPTTPTDASIVAALCVQEMLLLLHGRGSPPGTGMFYSGEGRQLQPLTYPLRESCSGHEEFTSIESLELSSGSTVGRLFELAVGSSPDGAWLYLDRDNVRSLICPACGNTEHGIYRPFDVTMVGGAPCPQCGTKRIPDVIGHLTRTDSTAGLPLSQLGIPPLHIVRVGSEGQLRCIELAEDRSRVFSGW